MRSHFQTAKIVSGTEGDRYSNGTFSLNVPLMKAGILARFKVNMSTVEVLID